MSEWTFITNHAAVLSLIAREPRITALELAVAVGITERAVRRIIADLHAAGYVRKKREGRRVKYHINSELTLRHRTHQEISVADFLKALGCTIMLGHQPPESDEQARGANIIG